MKDNLLIKLPQKMKSNLRLIGKTADNLGVRAYVVGGVVRDILLKKENLDLDIVVESDAISFAQHLVKSIRDKLTIHKKFGTATLFKEDLRTDFATARSETYSQPAALPDVQPGTIKDDLFRRDFTINAMAISLNSSTYGQLQDFFGGLNDLKQKKIRILHDLSFLDDPTRILRAIRFKERFDFSIEKKTSSSMKEALKSGMLSRLTTSRLFDELVHILKEDNPHKQILSVWHICGLGFIDQRLKINSSTINLLKRARKEIAWFEATFAKKRKPDGWLIYFIILLDGIRQPEVIHKIIKRFNLKRGDSKRILSYKNNKGKILRILNEKRLGLNAIFKTLEPLSYEVILLIMIKSNSITIKKRIIAFLKMLNGVRLETTGEDLKRIGLKPGRNFGLLMEKALYKKIEGKLKTKGQELAFIKRLAEVK
jgi:tRNA nucleotidyltransferase (CCA-adding enzyme)